MAPRDRQAGDRQDNASDGERFLDRWSRRKVEARTAGKSAAETSEGASGVGAAGGSAPAAPTDEKSAFDVSSLPDIDSLGPESDFSVFMQAGVPSALKTKALRRLWRIKPELANLDGLLDYGEDLTGSFKVVDNLKTAYQVGKGFLRDDDEKAEEQTTAPADDLPAEDAKATIDEPSNDRAVARNRPAEYGQPEVDPVPDGNGRTSERS